MKYYLIQDYTI